MIIELLTVCNPIRLNRTTLLYNTFRLCKDSVELMESPSLVEEFDGDIKECVTSSSSLIIFINIKVTKVECHELFYHKLPVFNNSFFIKHQLLVFELNYDRNLIDFKLIESILTF